LWSRDKHKRDLCMGAVEEKMRCEIASVDSPAKRHPAIAQARDIFQGAKIVLVAEGSRHLEVHCAGVVLEGVRSGLNGRREPKDRAGHSQVVGFTSEGQPEAHWPNEPNPAGAA